MNKTRINLSNLEQIFALLTTPALKRKRVLIVRHGESEGNARPIFYGSTDYPLTQVGTIQAQVLHPLFAKYMGCFDNILSSNLTRAMQTAEGAVGFKSESFKRRVQSMGFKMIPDNFRVRDFREIDFEREGVHKREESVNIDYIDSPEGVLEGVEDVEGFIREHVQLDDELEGSDRKGFIEVGRRIGDLREGGVGNALHSR